MARQRRRDTAPELAIRRLLHKSGLRYRVDAPLPGLPRRRADILFPSRRVAIFVDGCFWHGCPAHASTPRTNTAWWAAKLARNETRDRETDVHLRSIGWTVCRVWEHEPPEVAAARIIDLIRT